MKIEIILPDEATAGTLTYLSVENGEGFLNNVVLNDLEDGNLYTVSDTKMDQDSAEGCEPDARQTEKGKTMTLYEMLDRTMYWQECWIFENNARDQNMPLFKGTVNDARKETDRVWDYLMCEVDHYDCASGILVLYVKDEHYDEPMEGHYTYGDQWGKERNERPWVYSAEIASDLHEIDNLHRGDARNYCPNCGAIMVEGKEVGHA